jgi:hypothetical protein
MKLLRNRRVRRIAIVVALLGVIGVVVAAVLWFNVRKEGEARLARVCAELDATDPGWRMAELEATHNASVAPPGQNACEQALAAARLITPEIRRYQLGARWAGELELPHTPHPDDLASLRESLDEAEPALQLARNLYRCTGGGIRFEYRDLEFWVLDWLDQLRKTEALLDFATILTAADGRTDESLKLARSIIALDRGVGGEPLMISQAVRMKMLMTAVRSTERTLAWCSNATDEELALVQSELLIAASAPRLRIARRSERAYQLRVLESLESRVATQRLGYGSLRAGERVQLVCQHNHWPGQQAEMLELMTRLVEATDRSYPEQLRICNGVWAAAKAAYKDPSKAPMSKFSYGGFSSEHPLLELDARSVGALRVAATAVASERFRLKHGRLPTTLSELTPDFLTAVPADPYTGKPLQFQRTEFGVVVYMTRADGADDGEVNLDEKDEKGGNIGFRLFDPTHRRQPPLPKPDPDRDE